MKNILRLKKGSCLPYQDLLEIEFGMKLLQFSMLKKLYTEDENVVKEFKDKNGHKGYYFKKGCGAFLLDDDYEIIIRKVSKKRQENESAERIKKYFAEKDK